MQRPLPVVILLLTAVVSAISLKGTVDNKIRRLRAPADLLGAGLRDRGGRLTSGPGLGGCAALAPVGVGNDAGVTQAIGEVAAFLALTGQPLAHDRRHFCDSVALQQRPDEQ